MKTLEMRLEPFPKQALLAALGVAFVVADGGYSPVYLHD
jgi:hypothetical protein